MEPQPPATSHKDQRVGLIVFGALGIVTAFLCGLFCLFYAAMVAGWLGEAAKQPLPTLFQVVGFYGGACVAFAWLGAGSMLCRRWAPAVIIAGAWLWLVSGTLGLVALVAMHGAVDQAMLQAVKDSGGDLKPDLVLAIKIVMFSFFAFVYLVIPATLLAFYGRRSVRLTCEARDPVPRWTDGLPTPALIVGLMLALGAFCLVASCGNPAWPFFTTLLKGPPAHLAVLLQGALLAIAAWGAFRLRAWAWWLALVFPLLMMASFAVFMRTAGMAAYVDTLVVTDQQRKALEGSPFLEPETFGWLMVAYPLVFVAFMIWVKKHFRGTASPLA
ncbi:MAG: hypothetical protein IT577_13640 [Verrucomicrobiae bacterium]|nr:hypothetical protein [Verrucomicrobiae bacterium]